MKYIAILTALCGTALSAYAWDAAENAIWFDGSLKGKLTESLSVKLSEQLRYKDEGSFNHYRHTEIGAEWCFAKNWSTSATYRYILARKPGTDWVEKPMTHFNLKNKTKLWFLELQTRLRFSYLFLNGADDLSDVRPKLALMPTKGWTAWKLKPYTAAEGMHNFEENFAYRYRAGAGLLIAPFKKLALNLFIMQECTRTQKTSDWNESYNMGLQAGIRF